MAETPPGTIILLNGTASSGKTSLAKAIQQVFDEPYLHAGIDLIWSMFPWEWGGAAAAKWQHEPIEGAFPPRTAVRMPPFARRLHAGLHHTVAALAGIGHNLVVDHVLYDPRDLHECLGLWRPFEVWLVGVRCPLEIVRQRAGARPERLAGWPEYVEVVTWQFDEAHRHTRGSYDIEVDSSVLSPVEGALRIKALLRTGAKPEAFRRLVGEA